MIQASEAFTPNPQELSFLSFIEETILKWASYTAHKKNKDFFIMCIIDFLTSIEHSIRPEILIPYACKKFLNFPKIAEPIDFIT